MAGTWKKIIDSGFKINNKPLGESNSLSLTKGDLGLGNVDDKSEADIIAAMKVSLVLDDLPKIPIAKITDLQTALDAKVPITRTINGKKLTGDISLKNSDVGLGNVENKSSATIRGEIVVANIPSGIPTSKISELDDTLSLLTTNTRDLYDHVDNINKTSINGKYIEKGTIILDTTDIIRVETTLPSTGRAGEMVRMGQFLYVWQDEV